MWNKFPLQFLRNQEERKKLGGGNLTLNSAWFFRKLKSGISWLPQNYHNFKRIKHDISCYKCSKACRNGEIRLQTMHFWRITSKKLASPLWVYWFPHNLPQSETNLSWATIERSHRIPCLQSCSTLLVAATNWFIHNCEHMYRGWLSSLN